MTRRDVCTLLDFSFIDQPFPTEKLIKAFEEPLGFLIDVGQSGNDPDATMMYLQILLLGFPRHSRSWRCFTGSGGR